MNVEAAVAALEAAQVHIERAQRLHREGNADIWELDAAEADLREMQTALWRLMAG